MDGGVSVEQRQDESITARLAQDAKEHGMNRLLYHHYFDLIFVEFVCVFFLTMLRRTELWKNVDGSTWIYSPVFIIPIFSFFVGYWEISQGHKTSGNGNGNESGEAIKLHSYFSRNQYQNVFVHAFLYYFNISVDGKLNTI